ncbi:hypothetical protein AMATHDRAFT_51640 [Amanita thiersii Skay4041]|uniref:Uncharacterized protein n=1 Tax=Amanita thiersii Skay4041 TaxID=703135 RepID=A0A2A9NCW9_9AGAR|nr:hypothetical protein AMATHDRAFT_51640 [Amanita thiersii Skay4041]
MAVALSGRPTRYVDESKLFLNSLADAGKLVLKVNGNPAELDWQRSYLPWSKEGQPVLERAESQQRLPDDVMRCIFTLCAEQVVFPLRRQPFAYILAQVCSEWRRIALSTTKLWTDMGIAYISSHVATIPGSKLWLSHAANFFMSVSTSCIQSNNPTFENIMETFVIPHRLKKLKLYVMPAQLQWLLSQLSDNLVSELQELHLFLGSHNGRGEHCVVALRHRFPCLKSLIIKGCHWPFEFLDLPSWKYLRYLDLNISLPFSIISQGLRECISLEHCDLDISKDDLGGQLIEDVYLPHLSHLTLQTTGWDVNLGPLLQSFILPRLRELHIRRGWAGSNALVYWDHDAYSLMAHRSNFCRLHMIHICHTYNTISLDRLLEDTPTLRHVNLDGKSTLSENAASRLSNGQLGPKLEYILAYKCTTNICQMLEAIEERSNAITGGMAKAITPFKYVIIQNDPLVENGYEERIASLRAKFNIQFMLFPSRVF